jgi:hypothetical protein
MMFVAAALAMAACSSARVAPADASMPSPPFVQRLTSSADPSAGAPEVNLTQWNWDRQIAVDDDGAVHVVWARLATRRSTTAGASFDPEALIAADAMFMNAARPTIAARMPHIAVAPDHTAHILWYDTRFSDAGGPRIELFYARPNG